VYRTFQLIRNGQPAELLKIKQAGIFPNLGISALLAKFTLNIPEPAGIYK
jgi:hypothetical protein